MSPIFLGDVATPHFSPIFGHLSGVQPHLILAHIDSSVGNSSQT